MLLNSIFDRLSKIQHWNSATLRDDPSLKALDRVDLHRSIDSLTMHAVNFGQSRALSDNGWNKVSLARIAFPPY